MMFSSRVILSVLALAVAAKAEDFENFVTAEEATAGFDPMCPTVAHYTAPYHQDGSCDRAQQNFYTQSLDRRTIHDRLRLTGPAKVPSKHTSFCPQTVTAMTDSEAQTGFNTVWLVENTASTPVVIAFMLANADGTFKEVSAFDNKISPPNQDPKAILQPNQWKSLQTYEGHVFHVREITKDGSMGQVLMQHRVGLIPITNKYGHELDCNPMEPDIEPIVEAPSGNMITNRNFAREVPKPFRACNALDIGFRNQVGCPLNAYYTGMYGLKGAAKPRGDLRIGDYTNGEGHTAKSCHEVFKFHLGLLPTTPKNFEQDWQSQTKYEATFVGHNFVFRLAKDERIVVDSVAMHPTRIIDCPGLKNQVNVASVSEGEAIITPIMLRNKDMFASHMMIKNNATSTSNATWVAQQGQAIPSPTNGRRNRRARADSRVAGATTHSL